MTTAGGGWEAVGCLGYQKVKHSQLVTHHDSLVLTILLDSLEGSHQLKLNTKKEGLGCQLTCTSNEQTFLSILELPSTDREGLSLSASSPTSP